MSILKCGMITPVVRRALRYQALVSRRHVSKINIESQLVSDSVFKIQDSGMSVYGSQRTAAGTFEVEVVTSGKILIDEGDRTFAFLGNPCLGLQAVRKSQDEA